MFNLRPLEDFPTDVARSIRYVFSDLDDTITTHGRLDPISYRALCDLNRAGIYVFVVTGGPAGWCDCIARMWPVHAVVGESGAFYIRKDPLTQRLITRGFVEELDKHLFVNKMTNIKEKLLKRFPTLCLSSDQFSRLYDLAIELDSVSEQKDKSQTPQLSEVIDYLHGCGLSTKISSIHINATLGPWDKLSTTKTMIRELMGIELKDILASSIFIGDSLNDDTMFGFFDHSIGVANVRRYESTLAHVPKWITQSERGEGFTEFAHFLLKQ